MSRSFEARFAFAVLAAFLFVSAAVSGRAGQIPGQLAQDFVAGRVPSPEEIAKLESDVAAHPDDLRLVRKLGKAYFFQYFGEGRTSSVPKGEKMLDRALQIQKDDAETIAYQGALLALQSQRSKDPAERQA